MTTTRRQLAVQLLGMLIALSMCSCQKLCAPKATTAFTTFINQDWRLVSTDDPSPSFKDISVYKTLIFHWNPDFTGAVYLLNYNTEYTNPPAATFTFAADANGKVMQVQYNASSNGTTTGSGGSTTGTGYSTQYNYTLTTELNLVDTRGGYHYRFVPFTGIVLPDQQCTF